MNRSTRNTPIRKTILAAAIAAALTITAAPAAFAGGSTPQATSGDGYVSVCPASGSSTGCAPLTQPGAAQATGYGAAAIGFKHEAFRSRAAWTVGLSSSQAGTSVGAGFSINLH